MSHGEILAGVVPFGTSTCPSVAVFVGFRSRLAAVVVLAAISGGCARRRIGPNDAYHDPRVAAESWRQLFEGDEREIFRKRDLIMKLAAPRSPG